MDEKKREEIQNEAKKILAGFSKALEGVKFKEKALKERVGGFRQEGAGEQGNKDFRDRMFANAPEKEGDYIIAEKKKW